MKLLYPTCIILCVCCFFLGWGAQWFLSKNTDVFYTKKPILIYFNENQVEIPKEVYLYEKLSLGETTYYAIYINMKEKDILKKHQKRLTEIISFPAFPKDVEDGKN